MKEYKHIGYYTDVDAVMLNDESADKIVSFMKDGKGAFFTSDDEIIINEQDVNNKFHKFTEDGNYVVLFDVADRFGEIPLDLVVGNAQDEFIDIYKVIK